MAVSCSDAKYLMDSTYGAVKNCPEQSPSRTTKARSTFSLGRVVASLRRHGVGTCLAISTPTGLPSVGRKTSAPPNLSYAAQYLACALPCERFTSALAEPAHHWGPVRFATPSPRRTSTVYLLSVFRRTRPHGVIAGASCPSQSLVLEGGCSPIAWKYGLTTGRRAQASNGEQPWKNISVSTCR